MMQRVALLENTVRSQEQEIEHKVSAHAYRRLNCGKGDKLSPDSQFCFFLSVE